jgi:hypothetical protein
MTLLSLAWTIAAYASYVGVQRAEQIVTSLPRSANVTIYCADNLQLNGPGIVMFPIATRPSEYHFRYTGLRLLVSSEGKYFLLPAGWRKGVGQVILLSSDDSTIRIEFSADGSLVP